MEQVPTSCAVFYTHLDVYKRQLEDYPFALEVDEETFKKNEEMFSFLTEEADKRGIFVIQMFYNIILSKPFARCV